MTPINEKDNKYQLLQNGDIIQKIDEYYNPFKDIWEFVNDGNEDEDGNYPNACIGHEWDSDEHKPMRRRNSIYRL